MESNVFVKSIFAVRIWFPTRDWYIFITIWRFSIQFMEIKSRGISCFTWIDMSHSFRMKSSCVHWSNYLQFPSCNLFSTCSLIWCICFFHRRSWSGWMHKKSTWQDNQPSYFQSTFLFLLSFPLDKKHSPIQMLRCGILSLQSFLHCDLHVLWNYIDTFDIEMSSTRIPRWRIYEDLRTVIVDFLRNMWCKSESFEIYMTSSTNWFL